MCFIHYIKYNIIKLDLFSDKHLHSFTFIDETYTKIFDTYIKIGVSHIDAATWNTPTLE